MRLPFDSARSVEPSEAGGPDLKKAEDAVASFASSHPYLLFDRRAIPRLRKRATGNPKLMARLEASLAENTQSLGVGELRTRIKRQSRRLIHTAFLALIGDSATKARALAATRSTLTHFCAEPSWNPRPAIKSFLDSAEIAVAVSLAYDWLYQDLPSTERKIIEQALFRHVLEPAAAAYADRFAMWPRRRDNCALVSNSGILVSALAVLEQHRDLSRQLLQNTLVSSWRIFDNLAPDGAWPEGLSYWSLAMRYAGLMVAALETTFGHSFGLAERPGLAQTGDFALHAVGPFGAAFNFGDSDAHFDRSPLTWFAHRFKRPNDARLIEDYDGWYLPFAAIWPDRSRNKPVEPPTGKVFYSGSLACFRNTWSTGPAQRPVFLAIKGGSRTGAASPSRPEEVILHSQADAGSFIVDGARCRWITDLGADDYDLPGYFDHGTDTQSGSRWRYYRTQTAGHNSLVIDGRNQIPDARAPIVGHHVDGHSQWAVFDLSACYGKPAGSVRRGAALIGRQVLIQDEIAADVSGTLRWAAHTCAEPVSVAGPVARFRSGGDRLVVRILEPASAYFELDFPPEPGAFPIADVRQLHGRCAVESAGLLVSELPRRGDAEDKRAGGELIRRLQIAWPKGVRRLVVALLPDCEEEELPLPIRPLDDWLARRPVRLARYPRPGYRARAARDRRLHAPAWLAASEARCTAQLPL